MCVSIDVCVCVCARTLSVSSVIEQRIRGISRPLEASDKGLVEWFELGDDFCYTPEEELQSGISHRYESTCLQ